MTDARRDGGRAPTDPPASGLQIGVSVTALVVTGLLGLAFSAIDLVLMLFVGGIDVPNGRTDVTASRVSMGLLLLVATVLWWSGVVVTTRAVGRKRTGLGPAFGFGLGSLLPHLSAWGIGNGS
ncbi:hypothetical protein E9228_001460 [Curtobacterium flaccumfaciens]|uniref:Uncharacterized protein n=1 Tax=Curtobacterium salicis TaxID=1779862 RepID=A0ABX0T9I2_9MICO|nr:hypothetical protein [Curtobacterium sp. WW7]NII40824.1 hypothetical protein [Curtobacterium sp. WW7]